MNKDFKDISYLLKGNEKQIKSYELLKNSNIFELLKEFNPILVGTIPININVEKSDLDIVCEVYNFDQLQSILSRNFSRYDGFTININDDRTVLVSNFYIDNIEIEIYATSEKADMSNGYRHMLIEHRILELGGEHIRDYIVDLKRNGLKTEPAFAKLLKLNGNPYEELLKFENYSDEYIKIELDKIEI